jgi:hypothetical protein
MSCHSCTCVLNIRQKPSNRNGNRGDGSQQKLEPSDFLGGLKMMRLPELR